MVQHCRQFGPEHHTYLQHAVLSAAAALHAAYALLSASYSAWLQQLDQHPLRQVVIWTRGLGLSLALCTSSHSAPDRLRSPRL